MIPLRLSPRDWQEICEVLELTNSMFFMPSRHDPDPDARPKLNTKTKSKPNHKHKTDIINKLNQTLRSALMEFKNMDSFIQIYNYVLFWKSKPYILAWHKGRYNVNGYASHTRGSPSYNCQYQGSIGLKQPIQLSIQLSIQLTMANVKQIGIS